MPEIVPVALAAWVVLSLVLFSRLPGRDATLIVLIGGWTFLPVAVFPTSVFGRPIGEGGSMHALGIPTPILVNKATTIGLACLAGAMIFDWRTLRKLRPSRLDLPLGIWCLTPFVSALVNGLGLAEGLAQCRYLALAWGVPYLMGRAYLIDNESLRRLGLGLIASGILCAPLCLLEFFVKPFLYGSLYGSHPYQLEGATRYLLFRPLLFLEHGNQFGMWEASEAVAAVWLWRSGAMNEISRRTAFVSAGLLTLFCILFQSLGAIVLAALALAFMVLVVRLEFRGKTVQWVVALLILLSVAGAVGGAAVMKTGGREKLRGAFQSVGKGSFTWRLGRYEENMSRITERPVLGWARADWSSSPDHTFPEPVALGLWMLVSGMYGVVGLVVLMLLLAQPIVEVLKWLPMRSWLNPGCSAVTLAALLLAINLLDSLFNSVFLLPLLAGAGGINSWSLRRYVSR